MNFLVTGVSRGLGLEICKVLLINGHTVYGISRSKSQMFSKMQKEFNGRLFFKSVDLSNTKQLHTSVFKEFINNKIRLDGLVNNAAVAYDDLITNINIDQLQDMYRINVISPMVLTKYCIRNMIFNKSQGSIVHISSVSTHTGYKGLGMYASSKAALEGFSKNVAREWGNYKIRSNVVSPGFMNTDMSSALSQNQRNKIYRRTSLSEETSLNCVAETVAFVLSDKSKSMTGQNIHVDSGTL
jgi:3-oxoacyl-[acyl-carrier protein] reductase